MQSGDARLRLVALEAYGRLAPDQRRAVRREAARSVILVGAKELLGVVKAAAGRGVEAEHAGG